MDMAVLIASRVRPAGLYRRAHCRHASAEPGGCDGDLQQNFLGVCVPCGEAGQICCIADGGSCVAGATCVATSPDGDCVGAPLRSAGST